MEGDDCSAALCLYFQLLEAAIVLLLQSQMNRLDNSMLNALLFCAAGLEQQNVTTFPFSFFQNKPLQRHVIRRSFHAPGLSQNFDTYHSSAVEFSQSLAKCFPTFAADLCDH